MTVNIILIFIFPLFYILIGYLLKKHYSEFPNTICGYHIGSMAYKNENTWKTANEYSGTVLMHSSLIVLIISIIVVVIYYFSAYCKVWDVISFVYLICIALIPFILVAIMTEKHLRNTFEDDGNPKK